MEIEAQNAIYLGEETGGRGRQFRARFLVPGLVKYDYGVCLLTKENADKFIQGFTGCPVVINHQNVTDDNVKDIAVGDIFSVWFDNNDGYYWCNGIIRDKEAIKLINEGYSVSCQYLITEYSDNTKGALHNGNPYDKVIENGKPEHLAIVNNPRYEGAIIAVNAIMAENADKWITIHPNGEENKGRHLLLKDGESVEDAMHRNGWYEKRQAKEEKNKKTVEEIKQDYIDGKISAKEAEKSLPKDTDTTSLAIAKYNKEHGIKDFDFDDNKQPDKEETKDLYSDENFKEYSKRKTQHNFGKEVTHDENGKKGKIIGSVPRGIDPDTNEKLYLYEIKWQDGSVERLSSKKIRVEKSLKDLEKELNEDNFFTQKNKERIEKQKQKKEWSLEDYYKNSIAGDDFAKKWEYAKKHPWRDLTDKAKSVGKAGISADDANAIAKLAQKYKSGVDNIPKAYSRSEKTKLLYKYKTGKISRDEWIKETEKLNASNSFIEQFKDTLYTVLAAEIFDRLGE